MQYPLSASSTSRAWSCAICFSICLKRKYPPMESAIRWMPIVNVTTNMANFAAMLCDWVVAYKRDNRSCGGSRGVFDLMLYAGQVMKWMTLPL
jgi:hypothetical protein